jgi:hypothetical protein
MDYNKCRFNENKLKQVLSFDDNNLISILPYQVFDQFKLPIGLEFMDLKSEINIFCKKQINEQEN